MFVLFPICFLSVKEIAFATKKGKVSSSSETLPERASQVYLRGLMDLVGHKFEYLEIGRSLSIHVHQISWSSKQPISGVEVFGICYFMAL